MPTDATKLSVQPRFEDKTPDSIPWMWTFWDTFSDPYAIPAWGDAARADYLRTFAQAEPILAGALSSMVSKAISLDWSIRGGRNRVLRYQEILAEAENGAGWSYFLDRWLQDYLICDQGGFVELGRQGGTGGPVVALYNLDSAACRLSGKLSKPVYYFPRLVGGRLSGKAIGLEPGTFARIVDLPSPNEAYYGLGFSAVSRALKVAKVLQALYNYEDERLADMPIPGIAAITGMTSAEVKAAFNLYEQKRAAKEQVTFKGVLWLAAQSSPINPISVNLTSFASLPEGFDKRETIELYVYTLALDFGVDAREFWPASQTGATKAEAEVQAQKAKGKGSGRMFSSVERCLNWDVLPEGLEFAFDQKDSEDDLLRMAIQEKAIANARKLYEPTMGGEGVISAAEARRWLVEQEILPDWFAVSDETTVHGQANVGAEEEPEEGDITGQITRIAESGAADVVAEKAARARLEPGEDFVTVNAAGQVRTLWSSRRVFAVPNWPRREVAVSGIPFGTLTTEYQSLW
jgi:hypothetical protein